MSKESKINLESSRVASQHYHEPVTRQTIEDRFYSLAETWRHDVRYVSSITEIVTNSNYQKIIGMGESVVPFLLRELEHDPTHWFWALSAITGVNPLEPEDRGDIEKMISVWLRWGKEHGYEW